MPNGLHCTSAEWLEWTFGKTERLRKLKKFKNNLNSMHSSNEESGTQSNSNSTERKRVFQPYFCGYSPIYSQVCATQILLLLTVFRSFSRRFASLMLFSFITVRPVIITLLNRFNFILLLRCFFSSFFSASSFWACNRATKQQLVDGLATVSERNKTPIMIFFYILFYFIHSHSLFERTVHLLAYKSQAPHI